MGRNLASSHASPPDVPAPGAPLAAGRDRAVAVTLVGDVAVGRDGPRATIPSRKAQALLAFLALGGSVAVSRERLCGLLWSESSEDKARASLRQTLHGLKAALDRAGCDVLRAEREAVGLSGAWTSDVAEIVERLRTEEVDPRLLGRKRLADALLPGFDDLDPSFRVWLLVQRQSLQEQLTRGLEQILARADRPERAREAAAALLNLDPTHEEACRHAMRDAAARGDVAAALKTYKQLWDLLDEEYDAEPSEQTQALVVQIKTGAAPSLRVVEPGLDPPVAAAAKGPLDDHPFLIVSAFDGSGVGEAYLHLVAGLRHELIARLVRFREWSVIDGAGPPIDVGSLPGRCFSIDATLRQAGAALSLTLTTKEQPGGRYLWSESFAIAPERWFDLEPTLLRRIAMAVNVHLTTERLTKTAPAPDVSLGVYERWLRGQKIMNSFEALADDRSTLIFRSIIADAPAFSPAYSSLAQLRNSRHLAYPGIRHTPEDAAEALNLATKAVRIDPFDSRGHLAQGWALAYGARWDQAELALDLALKLNENDPWTLTSAALAMAFCGEHEVSIELAQQSLALMPLPPAVHWAYQATLRFVCKDYAGSAVAADRAEGAISNLGAWHAAALAHLGERRKARERADAFIATIRERWRGGVLSDAAIVDWFLGAFPIRVEADRARLRDGLAESLGY